MQKDYSKYKWEITGIFSIVMFLICYGLVFNQTTFNGDAIPRITAGRDYIGNGRFLGVFLTNTIGMGVYNPIINSILTAVSMYLISIYTIKIFEVKNLKTMLLLTAGIYTFPIFGTYWRYGSDMWLYAFATFLAFASLYYLVSQKPKVLISIALLVLSLSIYQVMISVMTMLLVCYFIDQISKDNYDLKVIFKVIMYILVSGLIYIVMFKGLLYITGSTVTSYKGADEIGILSILENLIPNIISLYKNYILYISSKVPYFDWSHITLIWIVFNLVIYIYGIQFITEKKNSLENKILIIIFMLLIPISFNSQYLITSDYLTRTIFGALPLILYIIIILSERIMEIPKLTTGLICIVLFFNINSLLAIETSDLKMMYLNNQITTNIITDIQAYPNYNSTSKLAVCGSIQYNDMYNYRIGEYPFLSHNETYLNLNGPSFEIFSKYEDAPEYELVLTNAIFNYYGFYGNFVNNECDEDAPEYPKDGYIYEKNGIININYGTY